MLRILIQRIQGSALILYFSLGLLPAQLATESALFQTLKAKDSLLFSVAFNTCDLVQLAKLTSEDMEFYHDKSGINESKTAFMASIKQNLCSTGKNVTERKLNENSLEVFPLYDNQELYGAIQKGIHYFGNSQARFTHLWLLEKGEWKLSRVLSYDHKEVNAPLYADIDFIELASDDLGLYIGDYEFSPTFVLSMVKEGNTMYGDSQGQKVEVKPYAKHGFLSLDKSTQLNFELNEQGRVISLTLLSPNGEMKAKKIK